MDVDRRRVALILGKESGSLPIGGQCMPKAPGPSPPGFLPLWRSGDNADEIRLL
jgi:hypothetical protein